MGLALGWTAIALSGLAGAPNTERANGPIQYSIRFVEVEGLGWREAIFTRLTPVTRQVAATVWTAPKGVRKEILQSAVKNSDGHVAQTGVTKALNGSPVHFAIRKNQQLVTQVAWNGDDRPETGEPETVRTGPVCTMTGRQLDQGVLVQLVLEDTEVLRDPSCKPDPFRRAHVSGHPGDDCHRTASVYRSRQGGRADGLRLSVAESRAGLLPIGGEPQGVDWSEEGHREDP